MEGTGMKAVIGRETVNKPLGSITCGDVSLELSPN